MVPVTPPFLFLLGGAVFHTKCSLCLQEFLGISYKNKTRRFDSFKYKRIYMMEI